MSESVIDAEVVEETGTEIVAAPSTSLFHTDDPAEVLKRAKETAEALAPVIREAGLVATIEGKDYLNVEAWQTLGQQVGVTPVVISTREIEKGWEARCEARTLDGRTIGAADSMCTRKEERWKDSEDFEIRSMAQTRAMSRALSSVLRFIPTLAGMGGTPAEEMGNVARKGGGDRKGFASAKQRGLFESLLKKAGFSTAEVGVIGEWADATMSGGRDQGISKAIDGLKDKGTQAEYGARMLKAASDWQEKQEPSDVTPAAEPPSEGLDESFPF